MKDLLKGTLLVAGGIVIGATAALLLTPQTGEETRKQLSDLAEEAKKRVRKFCKEAETTEEPQKEEA